MRILYELYLRFKYRKVYDIDKEISKLYNKLCYSGLKRHALYSIVNDDSNIRKELMILKEIRSRHE